MSFTRILSLLALPLAMPAAAAPASAAATTTAVITACVAKSGGLTRIVSAPGDCTKLETVLQFNQQGPTGAQGATGPQGPSGPAGPQGPAGPSNNQPFLVRTLVVPAGGTPQTNGQLLTEFVNAAASEATATNPYLIQLDAGFYDLGPGTTIPPFISIKGAGMASTFLTSTGTTLLFSSGTPGSYTFSVSDMTITGSSVSLGVPNVGTALMDHVHLVASGLEFDAVSSNVSVLITNSIIDTAIGLYNNTHDPTDHFRIVGTQAGGISTNSVPSTQACFASYNTNLVPYSTACQ